MNEKDFVDNQLLRCKKLRQENEYITNALVLHF